MAKIVNGYPLNEAGDPAPWGTKETNALTSFASGLAASGSRLVDEQHIHNELWTSEASASSEAYLDASGNFVVSNGITGNISGNILGNMTGNLTGNVSGDVLGNLLGDVTGGVTGNITGNVSGDILGDLTGDITGNVTGDITGNVSGNVSGDDWIVGNLTVTDSLKLVSGTISVALNGPWIAGAPSGVAKYQIADNCVTMAIPNLLNTLGAEGKYELIPTTSWPSAILPSDTIFSSFVPLVYDGANKWGMFEVNIGATSGWVLYCVSPTLHTLSTTFEPGSAFDGGIGWGGGGDGHYQTLTYFKV